jgi:hypothetical protein
MFRYPRYYKHTIRLLILSILTFLLSCEKSEPSSSEDCAGNSDGNAICGCTDSTAVNYLSSATYDDGSCVHYIDNGDFYLNFNGPDFVDIGDMFPQGAYTKAAWVNRKYSYGSPNNIISGEKNHALWAPDMQGYNSKLSAGHNNSYNIVQDTDSLPTGVWTFVAVTYDPDVDSGTMVLYKNGIQVDSETNVPTQNSTDITYIGRYGNGYYWSGAIDEVAIWDKALTSGDIENLYNAGYGLTNASANSDDYSSLTGLQGYWRMNEGEGITLSDASGNGNVGIITGADWSTCDECGCMDPAACNYNPVATVDNRSCIFDDDNCDTCVDGVIIANDFDSDGICDDSDNDKDGDGVQDEDDSHPYDNMACADADQDGCDDCSSGYNDPSNDGPDDDNDGICNSYIIEGYTVYIVGSSYNSEGVYTTCYWVDGVRYELPGGAWATDIAVVDGTVYTSGQGEIYEACYWINQDIYELPGNGGEAEAIAVHGNDIYVAGWFNNGSCYWKNGERINLTTNGDSQAFGVAVRDNGSVYIGGYFMNNHHYIIPCFWKDGNNRTSLPVPDGGDGEVNDIAIMDGTMRYYAGYTLRPDYFAGYVPTAGYWRHTTRTDLFLGGSSMDIYGSKGWGITIYGDDVYVAGSTDWYEFWGQEETTGGTFPQYWKNKNIRDLEGGPLTDFGTGEAYDIRVANNNKIVVGVATRDTSYNYSYLSACYWLNGDLHYLVNEYDVPAGLENWYEGEAKGVFVVEN